MRHVVGMDAGPPEPSRLQPLVDGTPRHPGRFHRHGLNPAGRQPVGQCIQVRGQRPNRPDRLGVAVLRHARPALRAADVQAGSVGMPRRGRIGTWGRGVWCVHGTPSVARGMAQVQTRSGRSLRRGAPGASPRPRDATTHHMTPDQHQSRTRAALHTRDATVFACLEAGHAYPARSPVFRRSGLPRRGLEFSQ